MGGGGGGGGGVAGIIKMLANNEINNTFPCSVSRTRHAKSQNGDKKAHKIRKRRHQRVDSRPVQ